MNVKAFWSRVKKLIKEHKLTQKQFAQILKIPSGSFEGLIYHNRIPVLDLALVIAKHLGVSVEYLATGNDREAANKRRKELADRETAARISKLSIQIQREAERIRKR